jgi:hypothetical protein
MYIYIYIYIHIHTYRHRHGRPSFRSYRMPQGMPTWKIWRETICKSPAKRARRMRRLPFGFLQHVRMCVCMCVCMYKECVYCLLIFTARVCVRVCVHVCVCIKNASTALWIFTSRVHVYIYIYNICMYV